jgi:hypothetical protein
MPAQLVFISLFLGLVSGKVQVDLQAGPAVKSIRILLDGRQLAEMQRAPWQTTVDFGPAVVPSELVAVGLDERGNEVARAEQIINLPRSPADFVIVMQNDDKGVPASVALRWEHLLGTAPKNASLTIDGAAVTMDKSMRAALPRLDMNRPHVIAASMRFAEGLVVRRELIVGGAAGYTAESEITPIVVKGSTQTASEDCFTSGGSPVRIAAVEKGEGLVIVIRDPDPREGLLALIMARSMGALNAQSLRKMVSLDPGTWMRLLWPVAERSTTASHLPAILFPIAADVAAADAGILWMLTLSPKEPIADNAARRIGDAVGVAGLNAMTGPHRRAVVLVLSHYKDAGTNSAAASRNYLASIGVPLFVWSPTGPRPDLRDQWGDIEDVSSPSKLQAAAQRLKGEIDSQRVAWVAADPLTAVRLHPTGRCGITPLARP